MGIFKNIIQGLKTRRIMALNKPIEVMKSEELALEFYKRLENMDKTGEKDDRFVEIAKLLLERENREKNLKSGIITGVFRLAKNFETKKLVLENMSQYVEEDNVYNLRGDIVRINNDRYKDDNQNKLRKTINNVYRRIFPVNEEKQMEKEREERKRRINQSIEEEEILSTIIYSKNIDKINIRECITGLSYENFKKIYELLSDEQKAELIFSEHRFNFDNEKIVELASELPVDIAKEKYLENTFLMKKFEEFIPGEKITLDDVKSYYRQNGILSANFFEFSKYDDTIYTSEQLIKEVNYLKNSYEKTMLYMEYSSRITLEEKKKMLDSEDIDENLKKTVFGNIIDELDNSEKIQMFKSLNNDEKKEYAYAFTNVFKRKDEPKEVSQEYMNEIMKNIDDEHIKGSYLIEFYGRGIYENKDVIFELLKKKEFNDKIKTLGSKKLCGYSDEQLMEIYQNADSKTKAYMLTLSRRDVAFWEDMEGDLLTKFEKMQQNNYDGIDEHIIAKPNNYLELLKNSKSAEELKQLAMMRDYKKSLTKEEILGLQNLFNKYKLEKEYCVYFVNGLVNNIQLDGIRQLFSNVTNTTDIKDVINYPDLVEISEKQYKDELIKALDIKNLVLRDTYMKVLTNNYIHSITPKEERNPFGIVEYENDEVLKILEELIKSDEIAEKDKYSYLQLFLDKNRIFYMHENEDEDKKKRETNDELFKYVNKLNQKELYNNLFCNGEYFNVEIVKDLGNDLVYEKLVKLYENNHSVLANISSGILNEECLKSLDEDLIEYLSRYGAGRSLSEIFKSPEKTKLIIELHNKLKTLESYPEDDMDLLFSKLELLSDEEIEKFNLNNEDNYNKLLTMTFNFNRYEDICDIRFFDVFEDRMKEESKKIIESSLSSRQQLLDAFGKRFLSMSYENMKELATKYGEDIELFIKEYEEKESLDLEEQNELSAMKTIRNIKEILSIKDKDAIKQAYMELDKEEDLQDLMFEPIISLNENVKRVYSKDYLKDIYIPKEEDKKIVDGIEVYSPKEFNMFVHVIGAYSNFNLVDNSKDRKTADQIWESKENKQSHIMCTAYVRNNNMAFVKNMEGKENKNNVKLGFANVGKNAITMSSPTDLASFTKDIGSQKALRNYSFRNANNLIDWTRTLYNEVDIERRLENNKSQNIQPSYVICFDEINKESKKVAEDFGIPIVYIDRKEIAKQESEKLQQVINEYEESKNPELLSKLIVEYQSNCNGLLIERDDLIKKYFNSDVMNEKVRSIIQNLKNECENGDKALGINGLRVLSNAFEDELKKYKYSNIDKFLDDKKMLGIRDLNFETKQILKQYKADEKIVKKFSDRIAVKANNINDSKDKKDAFLRTVTKVKKEKENER